MTMCYDMVFLTNTPSFYKLNLCNRIAKTNSVLLVFFGYGSEAVNIVLDERLKMRFDYVFLNEGDSNTRNKFIVFLRLLRLMRNIRCKKVVYSGWLAPEYNLYSYLSPKRKNLLVCESSIFDVSFSGITGIIKRNIINRMCAVLPSGRPHAQLFDHIGFKGKRYITGGVGIFNRLPRQEKNVHAPLRYLYVGRLIEVKNLFLLIEAFNRNGKPLTIVGKGVLEKQLKAKAAKNITFLGFINNEKLGEVYETHDVFILPSTSETWGLVVEEALYWGLPVIASNVVGSSIDMVKDLNTGCIFQCKEMESLQQAIASIETDYDWYFQNVQKINWVERDRQQVEAYTALLK